MQPAPGTRLGPYVLMSPLGSGGMGEVFEARDTRLDRRVAIKILRVTEHAFLAVEGGGEARPITVLLHWAAGR